MAPVTVEATQFVIGIPAGRRVTIERDRQIDNLIEQGRLRVVGDDTPPIVRDAPYLSLEAALAATPPGRGASREKWAAHLDWIASETGRAPLYTDDHTRDELVAVYDELGAPPSTETEDGTGGEQPS